MAAASIIVCTRNRAQLLRGCLESLLADTSAIDREVVVVDNGSTDETRDLVARYPVRYVREERLGHSNARNAGIAAATGSLLFFTDDDVVVQPGWADALAAPFEDPSVGAAAGRILPRWLEAPPSWLDGPHARLLTLIDFGGESRLLGAGELPIGANMAVRRELARPFDPALGHQRGRRHGHDEFHFMARIRETHAIGYAADAVVFHCIEPERMELDWLRTAFVDLGVGLGRQERVDGVALPALPRRAVRVLRILRGTNRIRRANENAARTAAGTWNELYGYMWLGKHVEMLFGRWPRLAEKVGDLVV
jgi:glycosyltransferase involved in cell wall biosynthesis